MTRPSGLALYAFLYLVFLYLPVLFLPLFSFNSGTIVAFPIKGWTLEWYRQLGGQETLIQALVNSLLVGLVAALLATSMGLFAARAYVRYRFRGKEASEGTGDAAAGDPGHHRGILDAGFVHLDRDQAIADRGHAGAHISGAALLGVDHEISI